MFGVGYFPPNTPPGRLGAARFTVSAIAIMAAKTLLKL
jgi:hypothetical protein